jgi:hypothetical protein
LPGTNAAALAHVNDSGISWSGAQLDATYYIEKQVNPALCRVINIAGGDVNAWYRDMVNKPTRPVIVSYAPPPSSSSLRAKRQMLQAPITRFVIVYNCRVCHGSTQNSGVVGFCRACIVNRPALAYALMSRLGRLEQRLHVELKTCRACVALTAGKGVRGAGLPSTLTFASDAPPPRDPLLADHVTAAATTTTSTSASVLAAAAAAASSSATSLSPSCAASLPPSAIPSCTSLDCPTFYRRSRIARRLPAMRKLCDDFADSF